MLILNIGVGVRCWRCCLLLLSLAHVVGVGCSRILPLAVAVVVGCDCCWKLVLSLLLVVVGRCC